MDAVAGGRTVGECMIKYFFIYIFCNLSSDFVAESIGGQEEWRCFYWDCNST